jgi:hypothetical protein
MCWDEQTSITTFILGTIINIFVMLYFNTEIIYLSCIIWQWILMMQLSDYFIWKDQNCGDLNKMGTNSALIFNLTQPIVTYLFLISFLDLSKEVKMLSSFTILLYVIYMIYILNQNTYSCITPDKDCKHLNLKWWNDSNYFGKFYVLVLLIIILSMIKPKSLAIFTAVYVFFAFVISQIFYGCGGPSIWCWLVVPYPFFLGLFYKYYVMETKE